MSETAPPSSRITRKRLFRWLLEALAFLLILYLIQLWQTRNAPQGTAPPLHGPLLQGGDYSLTERVSSRPLLIYFWADWCPVCKLTSGSVASLANSHEVMTVAMQSGNALELTAYLEERGLDYRVIMDDRGKIAANWGVQGVPAFFVLDSENRIRHVAVGYTSYWGLQARLWLAAQ